jgi:hypothetical protein
MRQGAPMLGRTTLGNAKNVALSSNLNIDTRTAVPSPVRKPIMADMSFTKENADE